MGDASEPRTARWSVVWHGYVRERTDGVTTREEGTGCRLEVYEDGRWLVCGGTGCVRVPDDDPLRFAWVVEALLGRSFDEA